MAELHHIPFNAPYIVGSELDNIRDAVDRLKISGNGHYTKLCQDLFQERYQFSKALLTSSCTDALEMASILANIEPDDEVIMPSYTFVSTANAFMLRGATIRFIDSRPDHPGMDEAAIEELVNEKTKAIIPVHYAGVACDMDVVSRVARDHDLIVIEDAAQAVDSFYKGLPLGRIGDLAAFSFHETKNIISGEGGLLAVNNSDYVGRAEIIWEKGTNRAAFWRGEVDKYGWVDIGSSFLPSEITAAFLNAQLEALDAIQKRRLEIWERYSKAFAVISHQVTLPSIPEYATNNAHMFYLVCESLEERSALIQYLKDVKVNAVFHYQSLHQSPYFASKHDGRALPYSDRYTECLVRLPLHMHLSDEDVDRVADAVIHFFQHRA